MTMDTNKTMNEQHSGSVLLIAAIVLSGFLSLYNSVAMNIAIPTFLRVFDTDLATIQWIMIGYSLMMGVMSPTAGYFTDKISCRNLFAYSMVGFAVMALLSGFCNNIYVMIGVRVLQGALAAFIVPCSMTIIYQFVPYNQRATFLTLQGMAMSMGPAIGPVISGMLLTYVNWQMMFWLNVPIALFAAWAIYRSVPYEVVKTEEKLDYLGFACIITGTVLFLLSFNMAGNWGFTSPGFWAMLLVGLLLIAVFIRRCMYSSHPILNFGVLKNQEFTITVIINSCISMALCLVPFVLAIYFQDILGYTPMFSGVILLIPAVFSIGGAPIAQWLYARIDSKKIILAAMLFLTVGSLMLGKITLETSLLFVVAWLCFRYFGIGLSGMPITDYGMSALPRELSNHGSALINWFKMMANSLSLSVFTMVLGMRTAFYSQSMDDVLAQMKAIDDIFVYSGLILAVCVILSLFLKSNRNLENK
ncbi:MAG: DHA2 family efflux MFS transporter permease subunit [Peptococcaceae bacterium]|nr:DHA2 family efflux MFS transporter permease subunit [Peptococcaceae bacterium]